MRRSGEAGLTLVEIMVVLIILGIVMAWLGGKIFGAGDKAKRQVTELKIKDLGSQISQFQLMYNALPSSLEDLVRCTDKTGPNCMPLVQEDAVKDGWGNPFVYALEESGKRYKITSYGADAQQGGEGINSDPYGTGP